MRKPTTAEMKVFVASMEAAERDRANSFLARLTPAERTMTAAEFMNSKQKENNAGT